MIRRIRVPSALAVLFLLAVTSLASADPTKDQCVDANTKGQSLQGNGKLADARQQFHLCAAASCPAIVRSDCTVRLDQIDKAQPSLVFDVRDGRGTDLVDVRVTVDGQLLTERLDGKPLDIDPGPHSFGFQVAGQPSFTKQLLIREGEGGRHEQVIVGGAAATPAAPTAVVPGSVSAAAAEPASGASGWRTVGWVLGGVGLVGLGVGAVTGILATSDKSSAHCNPSGQCEAGPLDSARTMANVSDVGFIAGGALLAGGAALILFGPRGNAKEGGAAMIRMAPCVGPGGAGVVVGGRF